ncbi:hypothetical protein GSI_07716 [Ganoderma sinense ZZ0214-1]|uniref:F-box domain-containing protein n=1 Tax=Ganoderma sinense ZZ0214-1 TaxID=1077348 RepID=A0A2G8S994_9APHY|nr:hypothetical protein GSI_07716 [Ganoderma sinense ZZ0214-1]
MASPQHSPAPFFTTPCREMGLDALERVITQIVAEVQTLVSAVPPPRAQAGSNYAKLLYSLHGAFEQGRAIVAGLVNSTSLPIHRVPPELLTRIFALSPRVIMHGSDRDRNGGEAQLAYWPFKAEVDVSDLYRLTKVCRYWRDLAIATPTLWTTVGTGSRAHRKSDFVRHSIFLPDNPSLGLVVHLDRHKLSTRIKSMLTNAPNIQELHIWDTASIPGLSSSWRFDPSALEHCTLWTNDTSSAHQRSGTNSNLPFSFNNGGATKLRSLCLSESFFHILPPNGFPALSVLILSTSPAKSRTKMTDLFRFLAGCPQLEEAYIYNIQRDASPTSTLNSLPIIALPRLRYLSYTHSRDRKSGWKERADPIECLLSHTSIPSTCHMYFVVDDTKHRATNVSIIDSVCRHVGGKDSTTTHLFLWLSTNTSDNRSSMQLVFPEGSLRIQFKTNNDCLEVLHSFPRIFSGTEDIRIGYDSTSGYAHHDPRHSLASSLPEIFPNARAITLIPKVIPKDRSRYVVRALPLYLADPPKPTSSSAPTGGEAAASAAVPHPRLDTLWILVQSKKEIGTLKKILAARDALGFPVRCVVVHHRFAAGSTARAHLRALPVEQVILTHPKASESKKEREGDWALRFPERFSLPPAVRRDWPTMWYGNHWDSQDDDSESGDESDSSVASSGRSSSVFSSGSLSSSE